MAKKMKYNPIKNESENKEHVNETLRIYDMGKPMSDPKNQEMTKMLLDNIIFNVMKNGEYKSYTLSELGNSNLQIIGANWKLLEFGNGYMPISKINITGMIGHKTFIFECPSSPMAISSSSTPSIIKAQVDAIYDKDCKYAYLIITPQGPSVIRIDNMLVPWSSGSTLGIYKYDGIVILNIYSTTSRHIFIGGRLSDDDLENLREFFDMAIGRKPIESLMDSLI